MADKYTYGPYTAGQGESIIVNPAKGESLGIDVLNANLQYYRQENDLVIYYTDTDSVRLKNFFSLEERLDTVGVLVSSEASKVYVDKSIKNGALITVNDYSDYSGSEYKESINLSTVAEGSHISPKTEFENYGTYNSETGMFTSKATGATFHIDSYADAKAGDDTVIGATGNNWINGGDDADRLEGGVSGHDVIIGGNGVNTIVGQKSNTAGSEYYGGSGVDTITASGGNDYINGGGSADTIDLSNGGANTVEFTDYFGVDTIINADADDVLKFTTPDGKSGYKFSDLKFTILENGDIQITSSGGSVIISEFRQAESKIDKIIAFDDDGTTEKEYRISDVKFVVSATEYVGTDFDEEINLKKGNVTATDGDLINGSYTSKIDGETYKVDSYASAMGGDDTITGTNSSDWLNGGVGNDEIYGGNNGNDVLIGYAGTNKIVAGEKVESADPEKYVNIGTDENPEYVSLNDKASVEIYGGSGVDKIYSGKQSDYIQGGTGNDEIHLYRSEYDNVSKRLIFAEVANVESGVQGFGVDTVYGATSDDVFEFVVDNGTTDEPSIVGYTLSDLSFSGDFPESEGSADLVISAGGNSVTVKDFFVVNSEGEKQANSLTLKLKSASGSSIDTVLYNSNKEVEILSASDYIGTDNSEVITLVKGAVNENDGLLSGNTYTSEFTETEYTVNAYARANGGNDTVYGTDGNDWINGGVGSDTIYGGVNGHDMLIAGADSASDANYIVAGEQTDSTSEGVRNIGTTENPVWVRDVNAGTEQEPNWVSLNTFGSEIYGGDGVDTIIAGGVSTEEGYADTTRNFIQAGEGTDTIKLYGGANTISFIGEFGNDTVYGTTQNDILKFTYNYEDEGETKTAGYRFSDMKFTLSDEGALLLSVGGNTVTIDGFKAGESKIDTIVALDDSGIEKTYSLKEAMYIDAEGVTDYVGVDYNENIILTAGDTKVTRTDGDLINGSYKDVNGNSHDVMAYASAEDGNDIIRGTSQTDWINGGKGDDKIYGGDGGHDMLIGGEGKDFIYANDKDGNINSEGVEIYGGEDDDTIFSGSGNDYINAGLGNDTITLRGGSNTLVFVDEFGTDTISSATSADILKFSVGGEGYSFSELTFTKNDNDLVISVGENNSVTIAGFYTSATFVDKIVALDSEGREKEFSIKDDAVINVSVSEDYEGTSYSENITITGSGLSVNGDDGDDIITSGSGNDTLIGNKGDDTIVITGGENNLLFTEPDFGNDTVISSTINDSLTFALTGTSGAEGYLRSEIDFKLVQNSEGKNDLVITAQKSTPGFDVNTVTLKNYSGNSAHYVYAINDSGSIEQYDINEQIPVERDYAIDTRKKIITGTDYHDIITGDNTSLKGKAKTIYGLAGDDIITAGKGNDKLYGGSGTNTFNFFTGDGKDTIYAGGGEDNLNIYGVNADMSNVTITASGNDAVIKYSSKDSITLKDFFINSDYSVKTVTFYSGTTGDWTIAGTIDDLTEHLKNAEYNVADMTESSKTSYKGSAISETIIGSEKNNTIKGGGGDDVIYAVTGTNKIYTETKTGDVSTVYAGYGKDTLNAGKGTDIYVFEDGHCGDTVVANTTGKVVLDLSNLSHVTFTESGNNLIINNNYAINSAGTLFATETIIVKNFMKNTLSDNIFVGTDDTTTKTLREYLADNASDLVVGNPNSTKKQSITGGFLDETLVGGSGADTIKSNGGKDILIGNDGNDKLYGYIAKNGKVYDYQDAGDINAKSYVFGYGYGYRVSVGDGKDTIYNSKHSDSIDFKVSYSDGDKIDAAKKFADAVKFTQSKNNLIISYTDNIDSRGKDLDTITITDYFKRDKLTEAISTINIYNNDNEFVTSVDLSSEVIAYDNSGFSDVIKTRIINAFAGSTTYDLNNTGSAELIQDNRGLYGNDTYNFSGAASAETVVYDDHGNDTYNPLLTQKINIFDTDGMDTISVTTATSNDIKVVFDVVSAKEDVTATADDSMFLLDKNNIDSENGITGYVKYHGWLDGNLPSALSLQVNGEGMGFYSSTIESIRGEVASWLAGTSYNTAFDVLNSNNESDIQTLIGKYVYTSDTNVGG